MAGRKFLLVKNFGHPSPLKNSADLFLLDHGPDADDNQTRLLFSYLAFIAIVEPCRLEFCFDDFNIGFGFGDA